MIWSCAACRPWGGQLQICFTFCASRVFAGGSRYTIVLGAMSSAVMPAIVFRSWFHNKSTRRCACRTPSSKVSNTRVTPAFLPKSGSQRKGYGTIPQVVRPEPFGWLSLLETSLHHGPCSAAGWFKSLPVAQSTWAKSFATRPRITETPCVNQS